VAACNILLHKIIIHKEAILNTPFVVWIATRCSASIGLIIHLNKRRSNFFQPFKCYFSHKSHLPIADEMARSARVFRLSGMALVLHWPWPPGLDAGAHGVRRRNRLPRLRAQPATPDARNG
jgi:hypothetical protein